MKVVGHQTKSQQSQVGTIIGFVEQFQKGPVIIVLVKNTVDRPLPRLDVSHRGSGSSGHARKLTNAGTPVNKVECPLLSPLRKRAPPEA